MSEHWSQQFAGLGMGAVPPELQAWDREIGEKRFPVERAIIGFDIDSTVSESGWRVPLINNWDADAVAIEDRLGWGSREDGMWLWDLGPSSGRGSREDRWQLFYSLSKLDKPYEMAQGLIQQLREVFDIVYVTGRPEQWRADTYEWLEEHDLLPLGAGVADCRDWLLMRPDGWFAPAAEVKMTLLSRWGGLPFMFFDDDLSVVQALNLEGIAASLVCWHGGEVRGVKRG